MVSITLKGNPRSTGTLYKTICRGNFPSHYMSNEGKSLKEDYSWQVKSQYKKKIIEGEIELTVRLYFGNKRKNDIDNFHKLSLDSMTGIVYRDDSQIIRMTVEKYYDKNNPRIEIEIYETE